MPTHEPLGGHAHKEDDFYRDKPQISFKFATIEDKCVKIWKYEDEIITTVRKINIKQKLADAVSSEIIGFLVVLSANGKVLILDSEGEYVSSLERSDLEFSSIA